MTATVCVDEVTAHYRELDGAVQADNQGEVRGDHPVGKRGAITGEAGKIGVTW